MCGIVGYYSFNNNLSKFDLQQMTASISHRGPDADGHFVDGIVGLGHRRLSIIDLSTHANQPMASACGRYTLVYNGEIYNYKEIAKELINEKPNFRFQTSSDTEVLLEAYAHWGEKCVDKLNGMFVFAIYDTKSKGLFLCRDRLGIKPLYYYWDGATFVFASELKAIKTLKGKVDLTINALAINEFLHLGYIPQPHSIYTFVQKMPSGAFLKVNNYELTFSSYWNPNEKITADVLSDEGIAKNRLKELLEKSVELRMVSDVPFGTFLSGGIDSSIVTAIAQSKSNQPINTFSIGFEDGKHNEAQFAKQVANHLKTNHHEFIVTEKDAIGLVSTLPSVYDEPYADSSAIPTMLVSKLAREHVKMTLSGDGGDELFFGYGAYQWAKRLNNPIVKAMRNPVAQMFSHMSSKYQRVGELLQYPEESTKKSHVFSQEQCLFSRQEIKALMCPGYSVSFSLNEEYGGLNRQLKPEEEQALFDINCYLKDDLLVKVDRATMSQSLETRVPLLDYNVVEFALNLSPSLKIKNGTSKYLLKEVLYDYVPKQFFDRPKWGFSVPLVSWLKTDLRFLIETYLSEEVINKYGLVNYVKVAELKKLFLAKNMDYLYNRIWLLIVLHQWLEENSK
jgi:asparagine synthase (glutamine-hydrolysing)